MTRGLILIKEGKKVVCMAEISSSAYPSYYGVLILDALKKPGGLEVMMAEEDGYAPALTGVEDANIGVLMANTDYTYIYRQRANELLVYFGGGRKKATLLHRIDLSSERELYRYIFENYEEIERQLTIDSETLEHPVREQAWSKAINEKVASHWGITEFQSMLKAMSKSVYFYSAYDRIVYDRGAPASIVTCVGVYGRRAKGPWSKEPAEGAGTTSSGWHNHLITLEAKPIRPRLYGKTTQQYYLFVRTPVGSTNLGMWTYTDIVRQMVSVVKQYEVILPIAAFALDAYKKTSEYIEKAHKMGVSKEALERAVEDTLTEIEKMLPEMFGMIFPNVSYNAIAASLRKKVIDVIERE